jgi:small GTP-binding protein
MGNNATTCTQADAGPRCVDQRVHGIRPQKITNTDTQHYYTHDDVIKVVVVGDSRSGKSSLVVRFANNEFSENTHGTIGMEFVSVFVKNMDITYKMNIIDTSGAERYKAITSTFYRDSKGFVIAVDCTSTTQFDNIQHWIEGIREVAGLGDDITIVIALTKTDDETRCISLESVCNVAELCRVSCIETSAKNNDNVDELFERIAGSVIEKQRVSRGECEVLPVVVK